MQVDLSATLSRLYRVLGDFHMPIDTLVQKVFASFLLSTFVPLALKLSWNHTYGVVKGSKQSLPLQFGFERFQYIGLNWIYVAKIKATKQVIQCVALINKSFIARPWLR